MDEAIRREQILGTRSSAGYLLRSPSSLRDGAGRDGGTWEVIAPEVRIVRNSALPLSLNQGSLWAGRGWNGVLRAGGRLELGPVTLTLAPELVYQENREFQIFRARAAGRDSLSSPWYIRGPTIDLPQRFGGESVVQYGWGQSSLSIDLGGVAVGGATENQWWGPGRNNALVLSANAPGLPHLFARTTRPLRSPIGDFEGRWILGVLEESAFFDSISANDRRAYSGFVATLAPSFEPDLTVGIARAVYSPLASTSHLVGRALDPILRPGPRPGRVDEQDRAHDEITAAFLRWIFPESGFEVYGEVARLRLPGSFRELLTDPHHSLGYTLGFQWARPVGQAVVRLHPEVTYLEHGGAFGRQPQPTYYTSSFVPQGYTHRGRVLGAGIGPGGSSQSLDLEYLAPGWHVGLFGSRIRWNTDAYYVAEPNLSHSYDVSLIQGVRAGHRSRFVDWSVEVGLEYRYNYLFQNKSYGFEGDKAVDVSNRIVRVSLQPTRRRPSAPR